MSVSINTKSEWFCYLLQCADATFYTGITNNLEKRLTAHNQGTASKYTRGRLPVVMIYSEHHPDRSTASKREAQIKRLHRTKKIALITPN
jgi:putative endonuclease